MINITNESLYNLLQACYIFMNYVILLSLNCNSTVYKVVEASVKNKEEAFAHQSKLQAETLARQSKPELNVESGCAGQAS